MGAPKKKPPELKTREEYEKIRSFGNYWREADDVPSVSLPPYHPMVRIYTDVSKRAANCQVCMKVIPKKTKRVVFLSRFAMGRQFKNGGMAAGQKHFAHTGCFTSLVEGETYRDPSDIHCVDCDVFIRKRGDRSTGVPYQVIIGSRVNWAELCEDCTKTKRYLQCEFCDCFAQRYIVSPVHDGDGNQGNHWIDGHEGKIQLICEYCADSFGVITVKDARRKERAERKLENRVKKIKAVAGGGLIDEAEESR